VRQIVNLRVDPSQERFVASNGMSISEAYFEGDHAWFRAVYADETPVGFVMLAVFPAEQEYSRSGSSQRVEQGRSRCGA